MIRKVISGGQTGADIAGLKAAQFCGLETGGWMPCGFKTQVGNKPEYEVLYGMQQTDSEMYTTRTILNVAQSDATIRFAKNWTSPGEMLTLKAINEFKRPHFDVSYGIYTEIPQVLAWLLKNGVKTLNVAGNSERIYPGMEDFVFDYLVELFSLQKIV